MKLINRIALIPIAALLVVACKRNNVEKPIVIESTNTKAILVSYLDENDKTLLKDHPVAMFCFICPSFG